jgi:amino acid adenylation domain-containing protein/non-ribosomal peptide synthase protein (TIGR01720 family)
LEENDVSLNLEDMYTLTPLQHGMLLHSEMAQSDGMYIAQLSFTIQGEFLLPAFLQAWQEVINRHTILRTAFLWGENLEPQQLVFSGVSIPSIEVDIRHLSNEAQEEEIRDAERRDRERRFDLDEPPLMRFTFLQTADDTFTCIWSYHHVLMDGWSLPIVLSEVFQYYEAFSRGQSLQLPTPKPYRDYIAWLKRQDLGTAKMFWQEQLKGFDTPLSLRFDRKETKDTGYQSVTEVLSTEVTHLIQKMSKEYRLTISTILQGAWGLLLGRTHHTTDVLFGATSSGRPTELIGSENMVGLFINTTPVRVKLEQEDIQTWLTKIQVNQVEAREHSLLSLVDIQGWSEVPRGTELFESIVVVENYPINQDASTTESKWKISRVEGKEETHYPITLICTPGETTQLKLMYQADRFARSTMEDILMRFVLILKQMMDNPHQKVSELTILTKQEAKTILEDWNQTCIPTDSRLLHHLFEEQVRQIPKQIAVTWGDESLTYEQLNHQANQLAHFLIQSGIGPDKMVGVCLPRSVDLLVGLLGILKAGGAYVPFDPNYPKERIAYMLEDSKAEIVITTESLSDLMTSSTTAASCLDTIDLHEFPTENPDSSGFSTNQLAYVIYTSGSTGKPKGVMIEHHSVFMLLNWAKKTFAPTEYRGVLASTSICFDLSVFELFFPISYGGTVVGVENALYLTHVSEIVPVTLINTVPSAASELIRMKAIPDSVKTINLAGEPLPRSLVDELYLLPQVEKVYNLYGPSEDTTYSTYALIDRQTRETPPIGKPIDNTTAYVLDPQLQAVPIGIPGELYLGGQGLTRGYLNRDELTAERYVTHPFHSKQRVYRTGDLVTYDASGTLQYIGRVDHQVKIRGFRIELGEIEAALHASPDVEKAIVVAKENRLIAYIITTNTKTDYEAYLNQFVPSYMVPNQFVYLDEFPLTPNGKVDRRRLPDPTDLRSTSEQVSVLSPAEEIVAGVWEQVLEVKNIQADDHFFQLGGHSLLATQVSSKLAEIWNKNIPLTYIFEFPTVRELTAKINVADKESEKLSEIPILDRSNQYAPASYGQRRLWFLDQMLDDKSTYHLPYAMRISGELDVFAFRRALQAVAIRHESLRTTFTKKDGMPIQVIHQVPPINLSFTDIREEKDSMETLMTRAYHQPFSLTEGPLWRVNLYQEANDSWVLLFTFHHIIIDGWSLSIFGNELFRFYESNTRGKPENVEPIKLQYRDYSAWQQDYIESPQLLKHLNYWKGKLKDVPVLHLPTEQARPSEQTFRGNTKSFRISMELTASLKQLSQEEGSTLFMTLLASWQTWLARYSGQEDISVGSPIAGRTRAELEGLIGFFVNTLVFRTDLSGNPSFQELLGRVRQTSLDAYAHQSVPFEKIVDELAPERSLRHTPLFQVMFVLQNMPVQADDITDLELSTFPLVQDTAKYDITLTMMDTPEGLQGAWEYNADLFHETTVDQMIKQYIQVLEAIIDDSTQPIREISLRTAEEEAVFHHQNQLIANYPNHSLAELWEEQVILHTNKIAIQSPSQSMTFEEVNEQANQLAHFLRKRGIRPESKIGICLDRSAELLIAILAIVKSGAAYVPFDVSYPKERFQHLVEDSGVTFVITEEKWRNRFQHKQIAFFLLDQERKWIEQESKLNPSPQATIDSLAYVMYTSGSTGLPKGVEITQRGIIRLVKNTNYVTFSSEDVFLQLAPVAFDAATFEIWGSLLNGAKLVIMPPELPSLSELGEAIRSYQVTTLWLTAGLFRLMVDHQLSAFKGVKQLLTGGDVVSPVHVQKVLKLGSVQVINGYGPTENTTFSCCYRVPHDWTGDSLPIGKPIAGTTAFILDDMLQAVPMGAIGELFVGGDGLARGYIGQSRLTNEQFIQHEQFGRLYRTGDLVRYRSDGTIAFLGRMDHQVKIRGFRVELGEIETTIAQIPTIKDALVIAREGRLIAYLTTHSAVDTDEIRDHLISLLPDYMVPASYILLEEFPLTENGKVDRKALPMPTSHMLMDELPKGEMEQKLADVWKEVLGLSTVNRKDNFFRLGGDSILSLQVIAKATQLGIHITPKQMFQFQTIAELAKVAIRKVGTDVDQGILTGKVELTPIQSWYFAQEPANAHHFNQAVMVQLRVALSPEQVGEAWQKLHDHHDALRLQFYQKKNGWRSEYGDIENQVSIRVHDLSTFESEEQRLEMKRLADYYQRSLNVTDGPITRLIYFNLGKQQHPRLLIIAHHLIVDGVSWRILLEDMATLCNQLHVEQPMNLPMKTTSYQSWAKQIQQVSKGSNLTLPNFEIPVDAQGENTEASSRLVTYSFAMDESRRLVQTSAKVEDILLTAFVRTLIKWVENTNVCIDLEGHGRDALGDEVDVSRTVGWFTKLYTASFAVKANATALEALRLVKNQRYEAYHSTKSGQKQSISPVSFNYLGQFRQLDQDSGVLSGAPEEVGETVFPTMKRPYLLDAIGVISGDQLTFTLRYSQNMYHKETMERLLSEVCQEVRILVAKLLETSEPIYTPADFPLAKLKPQQFALLPTRGVEDIYPLAPLQKGMLFHSHFAQTKGEYITQLALALEGQWDPSKWTRAWEKLVARHDILRTSFWSKGLEEPHQIVHEEVNLQVKQIDWQHIVQEEQQAFLANWMKKDQTEPFDLNFAPLMRIAFIQLGSDRGVMIWTHHHILLDGWSIPLLMQELMQLYHEQQLSKVAPAYRQYIKWLSKQSDEEAEKFWAAQLKGISQPTLQRKRTGDQTSRSIHRYVSKQKTEAIQQFAKQHQLTMSTVVQGAWVFLLQQLSKQVDMVYGVTSSGRPAELPEIEKMVGLFIQTLPTRVKINADDRLIDWLQSLQLQQLEQRKYEYSSLVDIQGWSEIPRGVPLFETLFVFENYPTPVSKENTSGDLRITDLSVQDQSNIPLVLVSGPGEQLMLKFQFSSPCYTEKEVNRFLDQLISLLEKMIEDPSQNVEQFYQLENINRDEEVSLQKYRPVSKNTKLIASMTQIWEEVLGQQPIDAQQNFFELGGHSFDALAISSRVEQELEFAMPLSLLFQYPTIAELCYYLEHNQSIHSVITMQQGDTNQKPLFIIHGQGGGVLAYADLVSQFGRDQTIYGIQSRGYEAEADVITDMEEMADFYVSLIKQIQPNAPYRFIGWSMGGVLAHLITAKLEKMGDQVELLVMIDSTWLNKEESALLDQQLKSGKFVATEDEHKNQLWLTNGIAFANYELGSIVNTPIHLFVAEDQSQTIGSSNWSPWTTSTVHANIVGGNHVTMLQQPHSSKLAIELQQAITTANNLVARKGD